MSEHVLEYIPWFFMLSTKIVRKVSRKGEHPVRRDISQANTAIPLFLFVESFSATEPLNKLFLHRICSHPSNRYFRISKIKACKLHTDTFYVCIKTHKHSYTGTISFNATNKKINKTLLICSKHQIQSAPCGALLFLPPASDWNMRRNMYVWTHMQYIDTKDRKDLEVCQWSRVNCTKCIFHVFDLIIGHMGEANSGGIQAVCHSTLQYISPSRRSWNFYWGDVTGTISSSRGYSDVVTHGNIHTRLKKVQCGRFRMLYLQNIYLLSFM